MPYKPSLIRQVGDWAVDNAKAILPTAPSTTDFQRSRYGLDPEKASKAPITALEGKKVIQDRTSKYKELDEELKK